MNKVGDHRAKCIPLSLLCWNKPGGFLRPWKETTSSLVSKLTTVSGVWFLDFSCLYCIEGNNDSYKYLSELCSPRRFQANSQHSGHSCSFSFSPLPVFSSLPLPLLSYPSSFSRAKLSAVCFPAHTAFIECL